MVNWLEPSPQSIPLDLQAAVGGHPIVAQVLARRGIRHASQALAFLDPDRYQPADPYELPGMRQAVDRLERAIREQEAVCVWGDFDVDGQTSTTLLVSALGSLGARVSYHIPVRETESHGVNLPVLGKLLDAGARLVLTCDTGINAHAAVAFARQRGVDMVITDHHDLPLPDDPGGEASLPPAAALVNPKLLPAGHALSSLPGVGVAYKLVEALFQSAGRSGECEQYLDLVALGIVADVALQTGDARYLLQRGLHALRQDKRLGVHILMELAELNPSHLSEEHIGYVIAPRLNAVGRLADANPVVELLTTQDAGRARILALQLEGLNARRKLLTDQVFKAARSQVEQDTSLLDAPVLVLEHPQWPAGVIGIVANRLVEHYHRPVILFAAPPGEAARGSARSIPGINITAAIASQRHLLLGFGGHPMAAGLSLPAERLPEFRRGLWRSVLHMQGGVSLEPELQIDAYVPLSDLSLELAADLERLAPFGAGNPAPVLATRQVQLISATTVGRNEEHLLLEVEDEHTTRQRVIWWQGSGWEPPEGRFDLAFSLRTSTYKGKPELQVEWLGERDLQPAAAASQIEIIDYRGRAHPLPLLQELLAQGDVTVWREGEAINKLEGQTRHEIQACRKLAIWTAPPSPAVLQAVLRQANPAVVILFGLEPGAVTLEAYIKRLAGLVKYALRTGEGRVGLDVLAAHLAQTETAVRTGLLWLQARGDIRLVAEDEDGVLLAAGNSHVLQPAPLLAGQLASLLEEAAAYRAYFSKAVGARLVWKSLINDEKQW